MHAISSQQSEHAEGSVAKSIEQQTAKLPSDLFLWAAIGSIRRGRLFMSRQQERRRVRQAVGSHFC
jgi:hypothetical protein